MAVDVVAVRTAGLGSVPEHLLGPVERARADGYRRAEDRRLSVVASLLVRAVAGRTLGIAPGVVAVERRCPRCGGPHGAPYVDGGPLLSVSHCAGLVVVAASGLPVGVDAEPADRRDMSDVAGILLGEGEPVPADDAGLLRTWVRKEAVLKATGLGLTVDLTAVRVSAPDDPAAVVHHGPDPGLPIALADVALPGAVGAVAVLSDSPLEVRTLDGTALLAGL
ncbi:4'-phosphopantetheinyl transferase superfamily protein [Antribacter sp. KLBMP9083]|uniref:4'-phosphopantetheinyl transferase superfamily protein n=1 Tax=Antribacter soli TaxID=2910976 RepID=A0AA41QE37_9MICO|nr:4'-phosphopantetheinyl transferase superfamily protein [Antribacter soli]MCF4121774.1 4'-phosphopantetheinyl transferase superfamily protein [Antribacter soli]